VNPRQIAAIVLWLLAWFSSGFIVAAFFAAADGDVGTARREFAGGLAGAAVFALAGALLW
jgi:hypothetical protein